MNKLQQQLKAVAMEYLRQTADLLGSDARDCYWVGTTDSNDGVYAIADFGDTTFLTFDEMQTVINDLPRWTLTYGSRHAVAEAILQWCDWSIQPEHIENGHARINLRSWLMGLRTIKDRT